MSENENCIEIEKKYVLDAEDRLLFEKIRTTLASEDFLASYEKGPVKAAIQTDVYYDTEDKVMYRENMILRIRTSKGKCSRITIKKDMEDADSDPNSPLARFEYEDEIASEDLKDHWGLVKKHCGSLAERFAPEDFFPVVEIRKAREKRIFSRESFCFEIAFDSVVYVNLKNNVTKEEFQIEIELKSDGCQRANLKAVTDEMEKLYKELKPNMDSKYKRAVDLTEGREAGLKN